MPLQWKVYTQGASPSHSGDKNPQEQGKKIKTLCFTKAAGENANGRLSVFNAADHHIMSDKMEKRTEWMRYRVLLLFIHVPM